MNDYIRDRFVEIFSRSKSEREVTHAFEAISKTAVPISPYTRFFSQGDWTTGGNKMRKNNIACDRFVAQLQSYRRYK